MKSKLCTRLGFLLLLLVFQSIAYAGTGKNASPRGAVQPQAAQSNEQVAGFDNPIFDGVVGSQVMDLIPSGALGFMLGASIVVVQMLRQRMFPASMRTIGLGL